MLLISKSRAEAEKIETANAAYFQSRGRGERR
jgi:hypothetical protein